MSFQKMDDHEDSDSDEENADDDQQEEEDEVEGIEVEEDFFSDPFFYDPVITPGNQIAFDVQGAPGTCVTYYSIPISSK